MIEGHGNNIYQYQRGAVEADFSSNVAFNNHSDKILSHLKERLCAIKNYPDPSATKLRTLIANDLGIEAKNILITNGSAEAFYLVAHLLSIECNKESNNRCHSAITTPSFSEYEDSCRSHNHQLSFVALQEILSTPLDDFDSLWLASPNNPDGYSVRMEDVAHLATKYPKCRIILDRAYNALSSDSEPLDGELIDHKAIIIESFTKLYGVPGIRLGYVVADATTIEKLASIRPPWSVNALSLIAGEYIMEHSEELQPSQEELIEESCYLQDQISQIEGFTVKKSTTNFFIVEITREEGSAKELQQYLLQEHHLLIRDASNFRGLTPRHFRVAAHNREANNRLIEALKRWR
ncbi:MAG: aminotransferase class I/II-fold pyridoxal phosphate-dependent enzyme [Rikenellaceae bacterium]